MFFQLKFPETDLFLWAKLIIDNHCVRGAFLNMNHNKLRATHTDF